MELVCRPCGWQWPPTFVSHCSTAAEFRWLALVQGEGCEGCEGRWMSNGTHMNRPESYVMLASFASVARPAKLCHASHMHRFPEVHCRILHVAVGAASDPCNARSLLVVAWIQIEEVFFPNSFPGFLFFPCFPCWLLSVGFCWPLAFWLCCLLASWLFDSVGYSTYRRMTRNYIEMLAFGLCWLQVIFCFFLFMLLLLLFCCCLGCIPGEGAAPCPQTLLQLWDFWYEILWHSLFVD